MPGFRALEFRQQLPPEWRWASVILNFYYFDGKESTYGGRFLEFDRPFWPFLEKNYHAQLKKMLFKVDEVVEEEVSSFSVDSRGYA